MLNYYRRRGTEVKFFILLCIDCDVLIKKNMYSKFWLIIKDDTKRTFEVCGQDANTNSFTNKTYAMQRSGMNVSCVTQPITNRTASKDFIKFTAYTREDGLYDRLLKEYRAITMGGVNDWVDEDDN